MCSPPSRNSASPQMSLPSGFLREERLAVVPGTAFGECGEGFLRISYAYSLEDLKKALERLKHFIRKLEAEK